ncbi:hypothetical protein HU200_066994 [Digitaria exilis]|uniref:Heat shock 70 kDa protein 17 n=1 Tax=Digitaria exilis TaxID=1010633 RepID=A0A835A1B3_9POAL|nr:hypothetical protein HU200_066994 [Digitaria exilis]
MAQPRTWGILLAVLVAAVVAVPPATAAVASIDLGSEWLKVAAVHLAPGRMPIAVAINEMSKRKSPALAALADGNRLAGEEAAGITARHPSRCSPARGTFSPSPSPTCSPSPSRSSSHTTSSPTRAALPRSAATTGRCTLSRRSSRWCFTMPAGLADAHVGAPVRDAVIAVPPYFGQAERRALTQAAQLAGINVLALINEHAGAALQYGIDKDFSNASRHVIFYDMGAGSTYAALVYYSAYNAKEYGKTVSANQFQVKDVRWNSKLGGVEMEMRLVNYFADQFNKQLGNGVDIRQSPKAMAKLKKQVKRTKEILSATLLLQFSLNLCITTSISGQSLVPSASILFYNSCDFSQLMLSAFLSLILSVLCACGKVALNNDWSNFHFVTYRANGFCVCYRSTITREKFEELCEDLWEQALTPVKEVLAHSDMKIDDIYAVELIGGATRVPKLQAKLQEFLGRRELDKHLDADEAIVLGASLHAANLSDGIKLNRKLGMIDGSTYAFILEIDGPDYVKDESIDQILVPRMKKMPIKLEESTEILTVSTEQERESFTEKLNEVQDWLYMDGEDAQANEFKERLDQLKAIGDPILFRLSELKARPDACENARLYLSELQKVVNEAEKVKGWLEEKETLQKSTPAHSQPAFTSEEVVDKILDLQDKVASINRIPKPKPKIEKKPAKEEEPAHKEKTASPESASDETESTATSQESKATEGDQSTTEGDQSHDEL